MTDLKIYLGECDHISWFSNFTLYLGGAKQVSYAVMQQLLLRIEYGIECPNVAKFTWNLKRETSYHVIFCQVLFQMLLHVSAFSSFLNGPTPMSC